MAYGVYGAGNSILTHNNQTTKQRLVSGLLENSASATSKDRIKLADHHVLSGVK